MSRMVSINEQHLIDMGNLLRAKSGNDRTYTPGQMAQAIQDLPACKGEELLLNIKQGHYYNPRITGVHYLPGADSIHLPRVITLDYPCGGFDRVDLTDCTSFGGEYTDINTVFGSYSSNFVTLILRGNTVCHFDEVLLQNCIRESQEVSHSGAHMVCRYDENGNRLEHWSAGGDKLGYIYVPAAILPDYEATYGNEATQGPFSFRAIEDYPDICNYPEYLQEAN